MKIAYIMSRFPLLSETFILREMDEVEAQGGEILLYPLICQSQTVVHAEVERWLSRRRCISFFSASTLLRSVLVFARRPFKVTYLLWQIIFWNLPSPKFLLRALIIFPKALATAQALKDEQPHHIHVHYATHPALVAYIIAELTGISYSITIHSHDIYDNHVMLKQKLGRAKFLVTISEYNKAYLSALLGAQIEDKTHVIHCGVDPEAYRPIPKLSGRQKDHFDVLQIGSLHWKKGQIYLLEAISLAKRMIPNLRATIIGDGPERPAVEAKIKALELQDTVRLMGAKPQSEVKQILPTADCYVQSSLSEGIPVALMEALACELPVVATNITGIPELIIDGKTGLLVPPKSPQALSDAICKLWKNPQRGREFGKNGRELIQHEFTLFSNVKELTRLFRQYLNTALP